MSTPFKMKQGQEYITWKWEIWDGDFTLALPVDAIVIATQHIGMDYFIWAIFPLKAEIEYEKRNFCLKDTGAPFSIGDRNDIYCVHIDTFVDSNQYVKHLFEFRPLI